MTLPAKLPLPVGANVTVTVVDVPALTVIGRARLPKENPAPLSVASLMVKSIPPVFAKVTVVVW